MHSWVFRNRSRLRWIYGPARRPLEPAPVAARGGRPEPAAGRVERREGAVLLHPMPRGGS